MKYRIWNSDSKCYDSELYCSQDGYIYRWDEAHAYKKSQNYPIERCTDLKDKNGVLIYEGDIIRAKTTIYNNIEDTTGHISWDEYPTDSERGDHWTKTFVYNPKKVANKYYYPDALMVLIEEKRYDIEIIGNIQQNPELLSTNTTSQ